jgi:hypothetical protein
MEYQTLIPVGTAAIIALRAKAEIGKRKHEKIDQLGTPWKVNTYTREEQVVLKKHVKIRVAELILEQIKQKTISKPYFTENELFCYDKKAIRLNDNFTTRTFVFPLLGIIKPSGKQYRPKQTVPEQQRGLMVNSILEMLKACYYVTDDLTVDIDQKLYDLLGVSADSEGILYRLIFTLSNVLKYRGKTIDEIFEEFSLPPPTDSDLYKKFTAQEKKDKMWPKKFNTFEVNGRQCSGSTPIYYGKHLKSKREEVQKYKESLNSA